MFIFSLDMEPDGWSSLKERHCAPKGARSAWSMVIVKLFTLMPVAYKRDFPLGKASFYMVIFECIQSNDHFYQL